MRNDLVLTKNTIDQWRRCESILFHVSHLFHFWKINRKFMDVPHVFLRKISSEQYRILPYNLQPNSDPESVVLVKSEDFRPSLPTPIPPELPSSVDWCFHASYLCQMFPSHEEPHVEWLGYVQHHPGVPQRQKSRRLPLRTKRQGVTWWGTLRVLKGRRGFHHGSEQRNGCFTGQGFDLTFTGGSLSWVR